MRAWHRAHARPASHANTHEKPRQGGNKSTRSAPWARQVGYARARASPAEGIDEACATAVDAVSEQRQQVGVRAAVEQFHLLLQLLERMRAATAIGAAVAAAVAVGAAVESLDCTRAAAGARQRWRRVDDPKASLPNAACVRKPSRAGRELV
eukprot:2100711-Prymnesium_polylepis.3